MGIRKYIKRDFEDVTSLLINSFPECSEEIRNTLVNSECLDIDEQKYVQLVAIENYKIVGYLIATRAYDPIREKINYWIDYVCVDEKYRGLGIAKKLLRCIEDIARREGCVYLQLTSSRFRTAARKVYLDLGFEIRKSDIFRKVL